MMPWKCVYAFPDDYIPEVWAQESLAILENALVMGNLCHRDYSAALANRGDVVHVNRPIANAVSRKVDGDAISHTTPTSAQIDVPLDQHVFTQFKIYDAAMSKSFKDLKTEFLEPHVKAMAQFIDQVLCTQVYRFITNNAGRLGQGGSLDGVLDVMEKLNTNKCPQEGRFFVVTPKVQADLLAIQNFTFANVTGESNIIQSARIGNKFGFDFLMSQNMPSITSGGGTTYATAITASAVAAGATSITLAASSTDPEAGNFLTVAGDDTPQLVTAFNATTEVVTISPGLVRGVSASAVVTLYNEGTVNNGSNYAAGWNKDIVLDTTTNAWKSGQMVSYGAPASLSAVVPFGLVGTPTATSILLDRSLNETWTDGHNVNPGPIGDYCFAGVKDAFAFVNRTPVAPPPMAGVMSATAAYNGLGLRVTMGYDMDYQSLKVNIDLLMGVALLNASLGCAYFA